MATTKTRNKTTEKPARKAQRKTITVICPHCGAGVSVYRNGKKLCHECGKTFSVKGHGTGTVILGRGEVAPVQQPEGVSCGWATTKWVLQFFGVLDISDRKLREELNTDAKHGVRAWLRKVGLGNTLITQKGTLPKAIFDALSRRGIKMKNPVRLESPLEYTDYLNETFDEGGCAIMLLANTSILHWMGIDRVARSRFRLMDPSYGDYFPFAKHIDAYRKQYKNTAFVVFGFVRA
ncbi:MAG: hypothetical protein ILM98_16055 [Kiritimatiellae bacterium]|nr:hypothetical protein [Kiritimatiellia bacterium]